MLYDVEILSWDDLLKLWEDFTTWFNSITQHIIILIQSFFNEKQKFAY